MVKVIIFTSEGVLRGFDISGHAGTATAGKDIVCAAVSSAAYLVANTITEVIGIRAQAKVSKASMHLKLTKEQSLKAQVILKGFELHINELQKAHPKNIKVIYGGVENA
ncbi:MAG TPA: ribosomal-processing cysteine protease Prp [Clostridia bacterium]|nr:ribosomal-processing cysteine protease Prp [Clostridia bacterium]